MKQQAPGHATNRTSTTNSTIVTTAIDAVQTTEQITVEQAQPTLPGIPVVDARFRINETTRRIGLAGVARARAVLAEQAARREAREATPSGQRTPLVRGQQQAA